MDVTVEELNAPEAEDKLTGQQLRKLGEKWIKKIRKRLKDEDAWRQDAKEAVTAYTMDEDSDTGRPLEFNIVFSNIETIVPAIYNSSPVPDIRKRYGDDDKVARKFADILERGITIQIDDNKLDCEMEKAALDANLAGRGIIRLRFEAAESDGEDELEAEGGEKIVPTAWSWKDFVMGRAQRWEDVAWVAFRHCIDRDEYDAMVDDDIVQGQGFDEAGKTKPLLDEDSDDVVVWEVWCKTKKTVKFIRDDDGMVFKMVEDPLGLPGFFPMAEPIQPISVAGSMMPVCPFKAYKRLARELDRITQRINKIMSGLKVRGGIVGDAKSIASIADADDNELITLDNLEQIAATKGLDGAITWWPVEQAIVVLRELYQQREMVKQSIYEITGISDIVRGASNSQETATAQQIKSQWGSLRIQRLQKLIQRQARDLFVHMADILATKFSPMTLQEMTGIRIIPGPDMAPTPMDPPEVQQAKAKALEETMQLMEMFNNPDLRTYSIDIESDSTIRADMQRIKGEMTEFLNATASYFATMAPIIQTSPGAAVSVAEIYGSFARNYKLGRQAEAALDNMIDSAKKAGEAAASGKKKDPEAQKAETEMAMKKQEHDHDMQMKGLEKQLKEIELKIKMVEAQAKGIEAEAKVAEATAPQPMGMVYTS